MKKYLVTVDINCYNEIKMLKYWKEKKLANQSYKTKNLWFLEGVKAKFTSEEALLAFAKDRSLKIYKILIGESKTRTKKTRGYLDNFK